MVVQFQILEKRGARYTVNAYEVNDKSRKIVGTYTGFIYEIMRFIGEEFDCNVEVERSIFEGWY